MRNGKFVRSWPGCQAMEHTNANLKSIALQSGSKHFWMKLLRWRSTTRKIWLLINCQSIWPFDWIPLVCSSQVEAVTVISNRIYQCLTCCKKGPISNVSLDATPCDLWAYKFVNLPSHKLEFHKQLLKPLGKEKKRFLIHLLLSWDYVSLPNRLHEFKEESCQNDYPCNHRFTRICKYILKVACKNFELWNIRNLQQWVQAEVELYIAYQWLKK